MSVPEHPKHKMSQEGVNTRTSAKNINNNSTDNKNNSNGQQQQLLECSSAKWKQYFCKEELSVATLPFHTRRVPHCCAILGHRIVGNGTDRNIAFTGYSFGLTNSAGAPLSLAQNVPDLVLPHHRPTRARNTQGMLLPCPRQPCAA